MSGLLSAATPGTGPDVDRAGDAYRPGVCNIGPEEIARRRRGAWVASVATVALYLGLLAIAAPDPVRFIVAVPAAGAAVELAPGAGALLRRLRLDRHIQLRSGGRARAGRQTRRRVARIGARSPR